MPVMRTFLLALEATFLVLILASKPAAEPGHLTRYRAAKPNPALKKVDEAFWEKFQAVSSGREMDVLSCYRK